jgi:hypothetical protein
VSVGSATARGFAAVSPGRMAAEAHEVGRGTFSASRDIDAAMVWTDVTAADRRSGAGYWRMRGGSAGPVVYAELPGAQHGFDRFHSIRFERVVDAVEDFAAWVRLREPLRPGK